MPFTQYLTNSLTFQPPPTPLHSCLAIECFFGGGIRGGLGGGGMGRGRGGVKFNIQMQIVPWRAMCVEQYRRGPLHFYHDGFFEN